MIDNKKIAIYGFGKEGQSCALYLAKKNRITIIDDKNKSDFNSEDLEKFKKLNIKFFFGGKYPQNGDFDFIVRSPGVRPDNINVIRIAKSGAKPISSTTMFFDECPGQIIGVTGTKGKGTTATLIYKFLKSKYQNVYLAGNIGIAPLDILPVLDSQSIIVLELSSFQLIDIKKSPHVCVVLMITTEHLDWHKNIREYQQSKSSIVSFQKRKDFAIINYDYPVSREMAKLTKGKVYFFSVNEKTNGIYLKNEDIISQIDEQEKICEIKDIKLTGRHNFQNVVAAAAVAKLYNIDNNKIKQVLSKFKGLEYRLQFIGQKNGVKFYNDSSSTVPETTIAAIKAFNLPKIVILGGSSKKADFRKLALEIHNNKSIKSIILIGEEAKKIEHTILGMNSHQINIIKNLKSMGDIVSRAYSMATAGDIVLFSPACASFDMFLNYQDRGMQFSQEINKLIVKNE